MPTMTTVHMGCGGGGSVWGHILGWGGVGCLKVLQKVPHVASSTHCKRVEESIPHSGGGVCSHVQPGCSAEGSRWVFPLQEVCHGSAGFICEEAACTGLNGAAVLCAGGSFSWGHVVVLAEGVEGACVEMKV